jgi:hypothetical protein
MVSADMSEHNDQIAHATMNGAVVLGRWRDTIYIRIPRELQKPVNGGCGCDYCKAHPEAMPMWDTLCVGTKTPTRGNDYSWTVHLPNPQYLWDSERKEREAKQKRKPIYSVDHV